MKRIVALSLIFLLTALLCPAFAHSSVSVSSGKCSRMLDGSLKTCWEYRNGSTASFDVPKERKHLLLRFNQNGCRFEYTALGVNNAELITKSVCTDKIEYCLDLPEGCAAVTLRFTGCGAICMADFTDSSSHSWQNAPEKTDLLLISAHQDDEFIFMGGVLPIFTDIGKTVTVAYTAGKGRTRVHEALEGLWKGGIKYYPDFLGFKDVFIPVKKLKSEWGGEEYVIGRFVELIRKRRPEVIVTHDINGEYGHDAHIYTSYAVRKAVLAAANPEMYPESAKKYGVWQIKKLYIHLYNKNIVRLNYGKKLKSFGDKIAADIITQSYLAHVSQRKNQDKRFYAAMNGKKYDNSLFGLYYSTVGYDTEGFFFGIDEHPDDSSTCTSLSWSIDLPNYTDEARTASPTPSKTPSVTSSASASITPTASLTASPIVTLSPSPTATGEPTSSAAGTTASPRLTESPTQTAAVSDPAPDGAWYIIAAVIIIIAIITIPVIARFIKRK